MIHTALIKARVAQLEMPRNLRMHPKRTPAKSLSEAVLGNSPIATNRRTSWELQTNSVDLMSLTMRETASPRRMKRRPQALLTNLKLRKLNKRSRRDLASEAS